MSNEKRCTKCRRSKDFSEFHRDYRGKSGLGAWCKLCVKESQTKFYAIAENLEEKNARTRAWYRRNKKDVLKKNKIRYLKNRTRILSKGISLDGRLVLLLRKESSKKRWWT